MFKSEKFRIDSKSSPFDATTYILLLKQFELGNCAVNSMIKGNYMVCTTLIRAMFETNMFMVYLSHNPEDVDDFIAFSEIIGNPDIDWKSHGISRTKRESLEKKFSLRKMIRNLYSHTTDNEKRINTEGFYQQLCNATHPSLEPSVIFYKSSNPPAREFSSIGIRRTVTQLFSSLNIAIENLAGGVFKSSELMDECYQRRKEIYKLHDSATNWHKKPPGASPAFTRNEEFRLGWKDGKAVITCIANA